MMDSEFFIKNIIYTSNIIVETPEIVKNKIHGDKTVSVRML